MSETVQQLDPASARAYQEDDRRREHAQFEAAHAAAEHDDSPPVPQGIGCGEGVGVAFILIVVFGAAVVL